MNYPFNPSILTSFKCFDSNDEVIEANYNRLEVIKQDNGCYVQDLFYHETLLAKVVFDASGVIKTISTFQEGRETVRVLKDDKVVGYLYITN